MTEDLVEVWRKFMGADRKIWVLFGHGTVVMLSRPEADLGQQAIGLLRKWGPVFVGTPAGDFNVIKLAEAPGWVVTSHHSNIVTYVSPDEVGGTGADDLVVGLTGRAKRDQDARQLEIVHVEAGDG